MVALKTVTGAGLLGGKGGQLCICLYLNGFLRRLGHSAAVLWGREHISEEGLTDLVTDEIRKGIQDHWLPGM